MGLLKVKHLSKQICHVSPKKINFFNIDIQFVLEEEFIFRDIYGKYSEEGIYIPFNDKNMKITVSNIDNSYDELKKYYFDIIEKQKKYINYRGNYFELDLFVKDIETDKFIVSFSYGFNKYYSLKAILEKLCENKNGILFDGKRYSDNYDENIIIERINNLIYIFIGSVYPEKRILKKDVITYVKVNAKEFVTKASILISQAEKIMERLKKDFGKDYWC
jgi:hypothetical protein